jgi:hypothetical protein
LFEDAVAAERFANKLRRGRHFAKMLSQQVRAVNAGSLCIAGRDCLGVDKVLFL